MVHIFELEPLETKKEVPTQDKEKEEAKPKENKKRKVPEPKEKKTGKKVAKKVDEKVDATAVQRPKRSAATKKRVMDEDVEEEKPAKRQKKEPAQKEKPAPGETKEKEAPRTRTPYVSPPLSTIVKGQYSAADLHNKFNLTDLQKYTKQEGLKSSGQKKNIIKRIVAYLETGKKDESTPKKGKPKKAKSTKQKKSMYTNVCFIVRSMEYNLE